MHQISRRGRHKSAVRIFGVLATAFTFAFTGLGTASAAPEPTTSAPTPTVTDNPSAPPELTTTPHAEANAPEISLTALVNYVRANATGACLDDSSYGLRAFPCNNTKFQRWNVAQQDFAQFEIQSLSTGRCLDDSQAYGLRTVDCNKMSYQMWNITSKSGGLEIMNRATNRCLDDSGLGLRAIGCNNGTYQKWSLNPA